MGIIDDSYCSSSNIKSWCEKNFSKDFDENMREELYNCDHIKKAEISDSCKALKKVDCNSPDYYMEYVNQERYNKYHSGAEDAPTDEEYAKLIQDAKNSCQKSLDKALDECAQREKEIDDDYKTRLQECENSIKDMNDAIKENNRKKKEYNDNMNECSSKYKTSCDKEVSSYSSTPFSKGKIEVSCKEFGSDPSVEQHYCDPNLMDGKCLVQNCEPRKAEECEGGNCEQTGDDEEKVSCVAFCTKTLNCNEKSDVQVEAVCHGYFKLYRSTVNGKKVTLQDTGMRLCPELFSAKAYQDTFSYKKQKYIKFFPRDYGGNVNG